MKLKYVSIERDRRCYTCDKLIKKEELRKVLSTSFAWFCDIQCYNEWEAEMKKSS
jgi:hypothetical protein